MVRPSNPRSRNDAVRSRNDALVRIRRTTVAMGMTATVAAVGIGVAVAGASTHHATDDHVHDDRLDRLPSDHDDHPCVVGVTSTDVRTTATTSTTTPSTTTTTPKATTTSGQS